MLLFFVHEFAQLAQLTVTMGGCKHLFFAGGFTNMPLVRSLMASEMTKRIITDGVMSGKVTEIEAFLCFSVALNCLVIFDTSITWKIMTTTPTFLLSHEYSIRSLHKPLPVLGIYRYMFCRVLTTLLINSIYITL